MTVKLDEDELRLVLQRVARRIRNNRSDESLGDSHMGVLAFLAKENSASPSTLAAHERVTPPSINRSLNGLEDSGLVRRERSGDDARRVTVSITEEGRALMEQTHKLRTAWFSLRLADLNPAERAVLATAMPILRMIADAKASS